MQGLFGIPKGSGDFKIREVDRNPTMKAKTIEVQSPGLVLRKQSPGVARLVSGGVYDTVIPPVATSSGAPTLLAVRQRSAAPGLFRLAAGVTLIGPTDSQTFDAAETGTFDRIYYAGVNDAVEFNGKHYILHTVGATSQGVWERQADGTWTRVLTSTFAVEYLHRTPLFVINNGVTPMMCFVFVITDNFSAKFCSTVDGTTWVVTAINFGTFNTLRWWKGSAIHHRGAIYIAVQGNGNASSFGIFDIYGSSFSRIDAPSGVTHDSGASICTIYGRVFVYYPSISHTTIYEITSGSLTSRATLANGGNATNLVGTSAGQPLLFADGDSKLVCLYYTSSGGTLATSFWRAADIVFSSATDNAPTVTQRDSLIPTDLQSSGGAANKAVAGFWAHVDNESDPGNPQVYIWYQITLSANIVYSKYTGSTNTLTGSPLSISLSNYHISASKDGGGERISPDDTTDARFYYVTVAPGTANAGTMLVKLKFKALDAAKYTAKAWISTTESRQLAQCTLIGIAVGGTRIGNVVVNCASDVEVQFNVDLIGMSIPNNVPVTFECTIERE